MILAIQKFADEELEQTNETTESEEELVEEEFDDSKNTQEEEETEKQPKLFTEEEVNEAVKKRLGREKRKYEREYNNKLAKYEELEYLTTQGLKATDLDDVLEKSRNFYGEQGIKYTPERSEKELSILANADAQDIIDTCDSVDDIEKELNKLLNKGTKITKKEEMVSKILIGELDNRNRISKLSSLGVTEEEYTSDKFKNFANQFKTETPIETIYELYRKENKTTKTVENPGSMKSTPSKEKKRYITEAEFDNMTEKEIEENRDLIRESMYKW